MNGEIPSVPITTLAGISSLTDLLPEMPLPSPLPQTVNNKSLLFHPRVAEEAQILLSMRDDNLVPQLINSLNQTSSDHIELKDQYASSEPQTDQQQNFPELLKAILQRNPKVFRGSKGNSPRQAHGLEVPNINPGCNRTSPRSFNQVSPSNGRQCVRDTLHSSSVNLPVSNIRACEMSVNSAPLAPLPATAHSSGIPVVTVAPYVPDIPIITISAPPISECTQFLSPQKHNLSPMCGTLPVQRVSVITEQQRFPVEPLPAVHIQNESFSHNAEPLQSTMFCNIQRTNSLNVDSSQNFNQRDMWGSEIISCANNTGENKNISEVTMPVLHDNNVSSRQSANLTPSERIDLSCSNSIKTTETLLHNSNLPRIVSSAPTKNAVLPSFPSNDSVHTAGTTKSPAQGSVAPVTHVKEEETRVDSDDQKSGAQSESMVKQSFVKLDRLTAEDSELMQKSLKAFAQKSPHLATKLGITSNHSLSRTIDSGSDSETEPKSKPKYFRAREKERELQRKKDKINKESENEASNDTSEYRTSLTERIKKRKRNVLNHQIDDTQCSEGPESKMPKIKLRKLERKLVPVMEKLSIEELMETNTYQRFNRSIETIFENTEDMDICVDVEDDADVPPETLIPKYQLQELCSEAAKLKTLCAMESVPCDRLVRLLNILEKNIRDGTKISPVADPDDDEDESKLWLELTMERVMRAADASLTALYILTSSNMPKRIYLEDVIDRIVVFTKYQLQSTIYPLFDPVYRVDNKHKETYIGNAKKKRAHAKEVREKSILNLYNKLHSTVGLLAELLNIQVLTDTAVLHASSMGVAPFFVENVNELQLSALKLVTTIFTKYEKHRRLLLDDILASIARLPSSKRSLRTYRLSSEEYIQMLTALVLQLIQCVVNLPDNLQIAGKNRVKSESEDSEQKEKGMSVDRDVFIVGKYENATRTAANFLSVFLNKCGSKTEEIDYRPLFENFVQDLLTTVNKPEWPATELLLSLLGKLLVTNFVNKSIDMSLRVASLDYLGVIAARLRKDAVTSQKRLNTIDQIIQEIKSEQERDREDNGSDENAKNYQMLETDPEEERIQFLQRVLLDYLAVSGQNDQALTYARHFYLAQWYRDTTGDKSRMLSSSKHSGNRRKKKSRKKRKGESSEESSEISEIEDDIELQNQENNEPNDSIAYSLIESRKQFLISKINPYSSDHKTRQTLKVLQTYIDYDSAELICRYLASKRPFSRSFDAYLKQILLVLAESSIAIRTKAMKCLTMVVEADPSVLGRVDMQRGVKHSFLDHSTSVREAAVDLVGKFVLSCPELIDKYYDMLAARILDTGVSVRKRVIKILKDICMECPTFPKIPEICVKMIRRVNDEEGIRKLVMEVFQNMWFTPVRDKDSATLLRKVMNITDVVAASRDMGLEWFEQLLISLFKPKEDKDDSTKINSEPPKALLTSCKQIVDCLVENVLNLDPCIGSDKEGRGSSQRMVACLTTLYLFAKIRPKLLRDHALTLQPYLSLKCQTLGDYQIISCVARTLELVVPLMEHPSETFLAQLEEDAVKLILLHDRTVVASCLSCLGSVVNNVTRNYKLIRDCFQKYYGHLADYKRIYEKDPLNPVLERCRPFFRRALFTVGLLLRHFDFTEKDIIEGLPEDIKDQVFETLMYFLYQQNEDIQNYTLKAVGSICIRHYEFMLGMELKDLYHRLLMDDDAPLQMRIQVLNNIEMYLQEEEQRMIKQDQEWAKMSKKENLKEMGDVSSGMASTIIQLYLKQILESFLHPNIGVRHAAFKVIQLILQQGLVHPVQIVPYLICMSTDEEKAVSHSADKQLQDIEKKYPGFINMKSQSGIWLSYKLQRILQQAEGKGIVRGYRVREGEIPGALNGFLYSILRSTKQQRRALALSILKQFDEQVKTSLSQMLYLSDNLAYFPYQVQDEPLFIIHHIDVMISVSGTNLLQSFREGLLPSYIENDQSKMNSATAQIYLEDDDDEDEEELLSRIPEDTSVLQECITASQGCLLLLVLKEHLKDLYGITDAKITQYSPSESAKIYEKALSRKGNTCFDPKATIQKLKEGSPPSVLDVTSRKALIEQYLDFKQLMLKFDPDDADEDDNQNKALNSRLAEDGSVTKEVENATKVELSTPSSDYSVLQISPQIVPSIKRDTTCYKLEQKDAPPRIPKLTIVPPRPPPELREVRHHRSHKSHKLQKHKKHRHKKKRKKYGSDDSEHEYSDPDFLI